MGPGSVPAAPASSLQKQGQSQQQKEELLEGQAFRSLGNWSI